MQIGLGAADVREWRLLLQAQADSLSGVRNYRSAACVLLIPVSVILNHCCGSADTCNCGIFPRPERTSVRKAELCCHLAANVGTSSASCREIVKNIYDQTWQKISVFFLHSFNHATVTKSPKSLIQRFYFYQK